MSKFLIVKCDASINMYYILCRLENLLELSDIAWDIKKKMEYEILVPILYSPDSLHEIFLLSNQTFSSDYSLTLNEGI